MFMLSETSPGLDPGVLLLAALALDAVFGDMRVLFARLRHPVAWLGDVVAVLDRLLNREQCRPGILVFRGGLAVVLVAGLVGGLAWAVVRAQATFPVGGAVAELFLVTVLLAGRGLYDHVRAVAMGLDESLDAGRRAVAHIVGRDPASLDAFGVARAGIESAAENFCDGVVAPVFWYVLFGLPGMAVYKAVNTMDSMIGYKNPRYRAFGRLAARLDDGLNFIPARLAGGFIVLAALFVPGASPRTALSTLFHAAAKHGSPSAGWTEAPMAGALGLALAGPRQYGETLADGAWMGDGRTGATPEDMRRALRLYVAANLITAACVAVLAFI